MKIVLLFFFTVSLLQLRSQTWCPPGATWYYRLYHSGSSNYFNGYVKLQAPDTVSVNGIPCFSMTGTFTGIQGQASNPVTTSNYINAFTYESNRVVYIYNPEASGFDTIANFNAAVGDQWLIIRFPFFNCVNNAPRFAITVTDTGHVTINNTSLKRIVLTIPNQNASGSYTTAMIEKIMDPSGFLFPYINNNCGGADGYYGVFSCYSDDNFPTYNPALTICAYVTGIHENTANSSGIGIYPNPNNGRFTLQLPQAAQIKVFNGTGELLYSNPDNTKTDHEINLSALSPGMYYLQTKSSAGTGLTKFIKE